MAVLAAETVDSDQNSAAVSLDCIMEVAGTVDLDQTAVVHVAKTVDFDCKEVVVRTVGFDLNTAEAVVHVAETIGSD